MPTQLVAGLRRSALAALLAGTVLIPLAARPPHRAAASVRDAAPPAGTDLYRLDTDRGHYLQGENGNTRLELYNSPVGNPGVQSGWHPRDLHLVTSAPGTLKPADTPFQLSLAATSGAAALAAMTNEDGVRLDVGLATIGGTQPAAVTGQVNDDAITYTAPVPSHPSDVTLRATAAGIDARVVIHNSGAAGPFAFSIVPDARARLLQDPDGAVRVTRAITDHLDDGVTPIVITQTEFIAGRPSVIDSGPDPVAAVTSGPVAATLSSAADGPQKLTLSIDQAWLHDARRVFPLYLDLPIATAESAVHSGMAGTVNSCTPDAPALQTDVVVGAQGGCTYHGQLSFDLTSLPYDTPIVSATLRLHTPDQVGPTGVQVFANTSPATDTLFSPTSWDQPSWNTAPAIAPNASGVSQSGSAGHEQAWDVTDLVRQWVSNARTNGGLTLIGSAVPVRFSSAFGRDGNRPTLAPSLDITYAQRPNNPALVDHPPHPSSGHQSVTPYLDTNAATIYGVAGDFAADYYASGSPYGGCAFVCGGVLDEKAVANAQNLGGGLGGSYVRLGVSLKCWQSQGAIDSSWWSTSGPNSANPYNIGQPADLIYTAGTEGLIPVVNILPPQSTCYGMSPLQWKAEVVNFVNYMQTAYPHNATIYFEVGNEENYNANLYNLNNYQFVFGAVAQGLQSQLDSYGFTSYHILTGGMLNPTAYFNSTGSCTAPNGDVNATDASNAIMKAENSYNVSSAHLGVAVHPYHYDTNESYYWRNYYYQYGYGPSGGNNSYAGTCGDLGGMVSLWQGLFPGMPLVFTEINWTTSFPSGNCSDFTGCEGTYLVDLFTWLADHQNFSNTSIRVLVYRGADKSVAPNTTKQDLGLYQRDGSDKTVVIGACNNGAVLGSHSIASNYYNLRSGACY